MLGSSKEILERYHSRLGEVLTSLAPAFGNISTVIEKSRSQQARRDARGGQCKYVPCRVVALTLRSAYDS